ncbi:FUSC family protein [Adhaeribacter aquaticus]|uniref:FUSC family protein n=1 Tax=Adhaeribacter aquaticus TaxID=299567 RepID=UPI00040FDEF8|nr:FUSC family protein [Adhaeribacter aquaticus]
MSKLLQLLNKIGLTLQIVKTAFAAALSWLLATKFIHSEYPFFAAVAAIITVQVTVADSVEKAYQRIIGIIVGVLLSMLLGHWFQVNAYSIFFIILIGMSIAKALRMNQQIISQVAISSLLVLAFGQTNQGYAYERIIETILGSTIAVLINALIIPQNAIPAVEQHIKIFSSQAAATLQSLIVLLEDIGLKNTTGRPEVEALIEEAEECRKALSLARQSLKYNPLLTHKRKRLAHLANSIHQLESITIQLRGIRRSIADIQLKHAYQLEEPFVQQLELAMAATARCVEIFGQAAVEESEEVQHSLKKAIELAVLEQANCLNNLYNITSLATLRDVGSILTDLGRIVSETETELTAPAETDPLV